MVKISQLSHIKYTEAQLPLRIHTPKGHILCPLKSRLSWATRAENEIILQRLIDLEEMVWCCGATKNGASGAARCDCTAGKFVGNSHRVAKLAVDYDPAGLTSI